MRWFLVIAAVALAAAGSASAELVARVPDGMIAVAPNGTRSSASSADSSS